MSTKFHINPFHSLLQGGSVVEWQAAWHCHTTRLARFTFGLCLSFNASKEVSCVKVWYFVDSTIHSNLSWLYSKYKTWSQKQETHGNLTVLAIFKSRLAIQINCISFTRILSLRFYSWCSLSSEVSVRGLDMTSGYLTSWFLCRLEEQ